MYIFFLDIRISYFCTNCFKTSFRGTHGGRLMQKTMSISATGKLMWWIVFISAMILGGFSVFGMIGISQNPNSEFNQKRKRNGRKSCS